MTAGLPPSGPEQDGGKRILDGSYFGGVAAERFLMDEMGSDNRQLQQSELLPTERLQKMKKQKFKKTKIQTSINCPEPFRLYLICLMPAYQP
ncbi:hypothetical protein [Undibacterium oligocarboniphilum]|uniref:Uncharacterized protein n=1 Tax=Undibacterium oligocarboniphilum TaxID=666702 RepID=A0A850QLZ6_9BURK|nr:hypothetical protein [Undibacterium oligocarboniphilum]MBC3870584.1 hypothetical protein [Undibacterium oligocarboniphilum]NVO78615.1 hypothetical protein [Undibacterium oligocarboniphilum]